MSIPNTVADRDVRTSPKEDMEKMENGLLREEYRSGHSDQNENSFECNPAIDDNGQRKIQTLDERALKLENGDNINNQKRVQEVPISAESKNDENSLANIRKEQKNVELPKLYGRIGGEEFAEFRTNGGGDLEKFAYVDDSMPLYQALTSEINLQTNDSNNHFLKSAFNEGCSTTSEISNDAQNEEDFIVLDNLEARRAAIVDEFNSCFELLNALDNISACLEGVSMISLREGEATLHKYTHINDDGDVDDVNPYINLCCMH